MNGEPIRSSFCGNTTCVTVQFDVQAGVARVYHSDSPEDPLTFDRKEWDAFLAGVDAGEFRWPA